MSHSLTQTTTLAQRGIWFSERLDGGHPGGFSMPFQAVFSGAVDATRLAAAAQRVLERHPVLTAAVVEHDGVPYLTPDGTPLSAVTVRADGDRVVVRLDSHHLVFDGESKSIFLRDLAAFYRGEELPPLPSVDLAAAEEERVAGLLPLARDYWKARWREPGGVVLPGFIGSAGSGPGAELRVSLDLPDLPGATRFEVLLASLQALLFRYGNADAAIGVDLGTRTAADRDRIGLFAAELPVFTRCEATWTFRRLAQSLRFEHGLSQDLRGVYRVREVPLSRAVPGVTAANVFAPVSLSYRARREDPEFPGAVADVDWISFNGTSRGVLRAVVVDGPDRTDVSLQYDPGVLDADAVARIAGHWKAILAADPETTIADLPLADAEDLALMAEWNRTGADCPDVTFLDLFEEQAAGTPDAVAVISPSEPAVTYAALRARTDRLAARLAAAGAGPGTLVAVRGRRTVDTLAALLATTRAGAAYLPLDPDHPAARQSFVLADSGASVLVSDEPVEFSGPVLPFEGEGPEDVSCTRAAPSDLAYVLYTSGSTGRPKGVEIGHRALTNLLLAVRDLLGSGPADRWLALTSLSFDISALELYLPLITGGSLVLAGDEHTKDGKELTALAAEHAVSHVQATPAGWRMLLDGGFDAPSVTALAGGETLPPALAAELRAHTMRLFNMYGPTETTIWSTAHEVTAERVTIGRPLANTRAHVLDERSRPVPIGVPGELCLGGAGVARGYRGRPELTAERFTDGLYRTGDLARFGPTGELEFLGRIDGQIKLRGHRIELGEIEAQLIEHPTVSAAAVTVHDERLVAYVVTKTPVAPDELRALLARTLPAVMIPGVYVELERLPLTPNGKLDRSALPAPQELPVEQMPAGELTELQSAVFAIVAEVMKLDAIGPDDDLFELGAHSLMITQISARIRTRLRSEVLLHMFYDTPTIAGIAAAVEQCGYEVTA